MYGPSRLAEIISVVVVLLVVVGLWIGMMAGVYVLGRWSRRD